jgi:hypothetical protein
LHNIQKTKQFLYPSEAVKTTHHDINFITLYLQENAQSCWKDIIRLAICALALAGQDL